MSKSISRSGIVVGVDGSPASKVAVYWAACDAAMRNIPLTVVHVLAPPVVMWEAAPMPIGFGEWQQEHGNRIVADALKTVEETTEQTGPPRVDSELIGAAVIPTLVDLSKEATMIVVGCRGRGELTSRLLGSVASALVHHADCPVAVIHDEDPLMPHPAQAPVLVGIDGSPASELATDIAFDEASRRGVDLVAMHAWSDAGEPEFPGMDFSTMRSRESEVLAERLAGWQERYPDVTVHRDIVCDRPAP